MLDLNKLEELGKKAKPDIRFGKIAGYAWSIDDVDILVAMYSAILKELKAGRELKEEIRQMIIKERQHSNCRDTCCYQWDKESQSAFARYNDSISE